MAQTIDQKVAGHFKSSTGMSLDRVRSYRASDPATRGEILAEAAVALDADLSSAFQIVFCDLALNSLAYPAIDMHEEELLNAPGREAAMAYAVAFFRKYPDYAGDFDERIRTTAHFPLAEEKIPNLVLASAIMRAVPEKAEDFQLVLTDIFESEQDPAVLEAAMYLARDVANVAPAFGEAVLARLSGYADDPGLKEIVSRVGEAIIRDTVARSEAGADVEVSRDHD